MSKKIKIAVSVIALNFLVSGVAMAIDWKSINNVPKNNTKSFFFCIPCII